MRLEREEEITLTCSIKRCVREGNKITSCDNKKNYFCVPQSTSVIIRRRQQQQWKRARKKNVHRIKVQVTSRFFFHSIIHLVKAHIHMHTHILSLARRFNKHIFCHPRVCLFLVIFLSLSLFLMHDVALRKSDAFNMEC